jgi:hypothetical protein
MSEENKKLPVFSYEPASDDFMDAVRRGGGIVRECEACGRTCFEDDEHAGDWENGELERLRDNALKEPDRYVAMSRVESGYLGGKEVVVNCPCNFLKKYEDFIWGHRHIIATYIAKRAKEKAEAALEDEAQAEFLQENVSLVDKEVSRVSKV